MLVDGYRGRWEGKEEKAYPTGHSQPLASHPTQIRFSTRRINSAALVQELFNDLSVAQNDGCLSTEDQRVDGSVLVRPLLELEVGFLLGHLEEVAEEPFGGRTGWEVFGSASHVSDFEEGKEEKGREGVEEEGSHLSLPAVRGCS